jgi:acetyl esterase/lipase
LPAIWIRGRRSPVLAHRQETPMPRPPFDAELESLLLALPPDRRTSILAEDILGRREDRKALRPSDELLRQEGAIEFEERAVPGPAGQPDISLLILRPAAGAGRGEPAAGAPGLLHIHGGGMILGDNRSGVEHLLRWVVDLGAVVVSVEYRLAPEHPDPAPVEDCYAGLVWTAAHVGELGIDRDRLAIIGTSAGGGLAAGVALLARDRGGPAISQQILFCPMLDDRAQTASSQELLNEGIWDRRSNSTGWTALLGERAGGPDVSPYAAPARAADLSGLPPAFIDVGSAETFRDENLEYAARLSGAGVPVELHMWPGGFHGFTGAAPKARLSQEAVAARTVYLRRVWGL